MSRIGPRHLSQLLRDHGPALVLYADQLCHSAEDVVQEAFLRLSERKDMPENSVAWLYRVVRNGALNARRAASRRDRHESAAAGAVKPWFDSRDDQTVDARQAALAIAELPDAERETVVARLWGGLSYEEIAELTGSSVSTAHRRYQSAIEALRERLGVLCPEDRNQMER